MRQRCEKLILDACRALRFDARGTPVLDKFFAPHAVFLERFGTLAFGQISSDSCETMQLPGMVAQWRDDHIRPQSRAVLSDTPTFVPEAALFSSLVQLVV